MPLTPPRPNIGRKARAKHIAVVKRMAPPQSVTTSEVSRMTDGTETASVVTWKKLLSVVLMPVRNMWCAHTNIDQAPSTTTAATMRP
jgi:hypothetical protein